MGFYIRKSVKAGPFRFNLSKSGLGVSTGVPGFRIERGRAATTSTWAVMASITGPAWAARGPASHHNGLHRRPYSLSFQIAPNTARAT